MPIPLFSVLCHSSLHDQSLIFNKATWIRSWPSTQPGRRAKVHKTWFLFNSTLAYPWKCMHLRFFFFWKNTCGLSCFTHGEELIHNIQDGACVNLWMWHSSHHLGQFIFGFCGQRDGSGGKLLCKASAVKVRGPDSVPWSVEVGTEICCLLLG